MRSLKQFYLFSVADASSAGSLGCEIRAAPCSSSRDCQYSNQMTVKPDSNVTLNCSVKNNGTTLGMTWEQVQKTLKPNYGLVLNQTNSTTRIYFTRKWYFNKRCTAFIPHLIEQTAVIDSYICIHLGERGWGNLVTVLLLQRFSIKLTNLSEQTVLFYYFLMTSGWYLFRITG